MNAVARSKKEGGKRWKIFTVDEEEVMKEAVWIECLKVVLG